MNNDAPIDSRELPRPEMEAAETDLHKAEATTDETAINLAIAEAGSEHLAVDEAPDAKPEVSDDPTDLGDLADLIADEDVDDVPDYENEEIF